ncbi:MAG: UvrD-helicase domain-containing protein [Candidatus Eisenbacteria bacterium]|nr:UvrD-helicase domain-containing protein [Candidatus Eisenbacteria bacterium]
MSVPAEHTPANAPRDAVTPPDPKRPPTAEQTLAVRARAPYLLVSASAGTGKTKTLIDKVVDGLARDLVLERLLVVTFTQKAAGELQERLFRAFAGDPRLQALRLRIGQAEISTIDAFCMRLLKAQAIAAGLDPAFRVLDQPQSDLLLAEILDDLFHHWYQGQAPGSPSRDAAWEGVPLRGSESHHQFLALVDLCSAREGREGLKDEIVRLLRLARIHPDPDAFLDSLEAQLAADPPACTRAFARCLASAWQAGIAVYDAMLERSDQLGKPASFDAHRRFRDGLARVQWPSGESSLAEFARELYEVRNALARSGWIKPEKEWQPLFPKLPSGSRSALGKLNDLAKSLLGGEPKSRRACPCAWIPAVHEDFQAQFVGSSSPARTLLDLVRRTMTRYEARKHEEGGVDFADLELCARRLMLADVEGVNDRFDLVLVDEFQDINRLQADIIDRLRARAGRFLVGDGKQCIYQFRLSEPEIFRGLCEGALELCPRSEDDLSLDAEERVGGAQRVRLVLSRNFRARAYVLAFVNGIFDGLMPPAMLGGAYRGEALAFGATEGFGEPCATVGAVPYLGDGVPGEPDARACEGRAVPAGWAPVEAHFLLPPPRDDDSESQDALVAEAAWIADHARRLVASGLSICVDKIWRPVGYGDIAILLRSPGAMGMPFARALRDHGLPVSFGVQGFFEREEVRDFRSLLRVLDNADDDLALAALLRAPGSPFTDADLVRLRLAWPASGSLIAAMRASAHDRGDRASGERAHRETGPEEQAAWKDLQTKCAAWVERLDRWREQVAIRDLPAALAFVLEDSGLWAVSTGQDAPVERIGNLEQLLVMARAYCAERGHHLPGFLKTLDDLEASGAGPEPVVEPEESVVRLLSVHKAKGLEFPVVYLAQLGRAFNTQDLRRPLLAGEAWIGVDQFDPQEYVKTPTIARHVLAYERRRRLIEEELRLLYVALTRAKEKLVLVGTAPGKWPSLCEEAELWRVPALSETLAYRARRPLDWIAGRLAALGYLEALRQPGDTSQPCAALMLGLHDAAGDGVRADQPEPDRETEETEARIERVVAAEGERAAPAEEAAALAARLRARYAHERAIAWRGKYWATEVKRFADLDRSIEEREAGTAFDSPFASSQEKEQQSALDPRDEGTWFHAVLSAIDFEHVAQDDPLPAVLACARAAAPHIGLAPDEVRPEMIAPLVAFFRSPLAAEMRACRATLEREAPFALKIRPAELAAVWPKAAELDEREWLLIQGQIDALWTRADGTRVVLDFKSDRVASGPEALARAQSYAAQLRLYRLAAARLWHAERAACYLYFLRPAALVPIE